MKYIVAGVMLAAGVASHDTVSSHAHETGKCSSNSKAVTVLLQNKVEDMGVPCEEMCKELGAYPNCQCPGFAGMPASEGDDRACYVKYCQDPSHPCPTEDFVTCTKELTTVAVLQWDTVFSHVSQSLDAMVHNMRLGKAAVALHSEAGRCSSNSKAMTVLLQNKVEDMGVPCEEMCKELGAY